MQEVINLNGPFYVIYNSNGIESEKGFIAHYTRNTASHIGT
jgi:hypothetical protein